MSIVPDVMHAYAMVSMGFLLLHQMFLYAKDPIHMSIVSVIWPQIVCYCFSLEPRVAVTSCLYSKTKPNF